MRSPALGKLRQADDPGHQPTPTTPPARVFPELATLTDDIAAAAWVLRLLDQYPTAERIAAAHLASLEKIPYLPGEKPRRCTRPRQSVALRGPVAEALVGELVASPSGPEGREAALRKLLAAAFAKLPASPHVQIITVPGIGTATAAALVAKIVDIDRFCHPDQVVGYFGVFPEENSSKLTSGATSCPALVHVAKGNDLVRSYLWNAACTAIRYNPAVGRSPSPPHGPEAGTSGHQDAQAPPPRLRRLEDRSPVRPEALPVEDPGDAPSSTMIPQDPAAGATSFSVNENAGGQRGMCPGERVVTLLVQVQPTRPSVKGVATTGGGSGLPQVDFAFCARSESGKEQVLPHLGLLGS